MKTLRSICCLLFNLLLLTGCAVFGGSGGPGTRVSPEQYTDQVLAAKAFTEAQIQTACPYGIWKAFSSYGDTRGMQVTVVPGVKKINGMWCINHPEIGWCGGFQETGHITVVCDPKTGTLSDRVIRHEWGHAILWVSHVPTAEHHTVLKKAGLY